MLRRALALLTLGITGVHGEVHAQEAEAPPEEEPEVPAEEPVEEEEVPAEESPPEETDSLNLTAKPAAGKGAIVGIVRQTEDGEPAMDAYVGVVGTDIAVLTDIDGSYRLELPPGKYTIQIVAELRTPLRSEALVVAKGALTRLDAKVVLEEAAIEPEVETVVEVEPASVQNLLLERQRGAASGDSVGRAEITKANDRNAAEAAKRVVGANIEGSRFLFVRGLGERYTNALLDGFPLPSPEPDRQAVPLDLFPSQILDSLTVVKTFTPDVPGDFAGGSVRIATRRIPNSLTLAGSVSVGFNTVSTFADNLSHAGGDLDFLGIDDGTRALPDDLPTYKLVFFGDKPDGGEISRDEIKEYGLALNSAMDASRTLGAPNFSGNFVAADSFALGDWGRIGVMGALVYDRRLERVVEGRLRRFSFEVNPESPLEQQNDLGYERSTQLISWGGLAGATLEVGEEHTISLTGLYTRAADISTTLYGGILAEKQSKHSDARYSFVARELLFGEISGKHVFKDARRLELEYGLGLARATRDEPNTRGVVYQFDAPSDTFAFEDDSSSGSHFFSEQSETTIGGKVDLTLPVVEKEVLELKSGGAFTLRERDFLARRFRFRPDNENGPPGFDQCPPDNILGCPNRLFKDEYIESEALELEENTRENDGYRAGLSVIAAYLMVDTRPAPEWRLTLGQRLEVSSQDITPFNPINLDTPEVTTTLEELSLLPAALVTYTPIPKANLRASVTRTTARPQLRELAPFQYVSYFGGPDTRGNELLTNTSIINADTRFEFFPTSREVLAVSAFYKRFVDPIEQVLDPDTGNGTISFVNAPFGDLFGIELEARKSLDFIVDELRVLTVISNVTFAHSSVELEAESAVALTSQSRPLSQQAPFIVNVALDFDNPDWGTRARVLYNVVGSRLTLVGTKGIPDVYERPKHGLDLTIGQRVGKHLELRGAASNLLNFPTVREHKVREGEAEAIVEEYSTGTTLSLGMSLTY